MIKELTIRRPFNGHVHLRDGAMLGAVAPITAGIFTHAVVMGNLTPPIVTGFDAEQYRERIKKAAPGFEPLMTVMLVNRTTPDILCGAYKSGVRILKLIPGGTSTGSGKGEDQNAGVALVNLEKYYPVLQRAQELNMVFSGHWELLADEETGEEIPEVEREERAIPFLRQIINDFPRLRIAVEHVSTAAMVKLVELAPDNVVATITPQHVTITTNDALDASGRIAFPHNYCKPIAKSLEDADKVIWAMTGGGPKFFLGTDSASHPPETKCYRGENGAIPPNAGIFNEIVALPLYLDVFERWAGLEKAEVECFETFTSLNGPKFHGLPPSEETITLVREPWIVPDKIAGVVPFKAGEILPWKIAE